MKCKKCNGEIEYHEILACYECKDCGWVEIIKEVLYEYQEASDEKISNK